MKRILILSLLGCTLAACVRVLWCKISVDINLDKYDRTAQYMIQVITNEVNYLLVDTKPKDAWGRMLSFEKSGERLVVVSKGADPEDERDDIKLMSNPTKGQLSIGYEYHDHFYSSDRFED